MRSVISSIWAVAKLHQFTASFSAGAMGFLANIEDPDEMPHNAAFHQALHCLLRLKPSSEKEIQF